jgi:transcriptional regulator of aromatic amino acid metabolism
MKCTVTATSGLIGPIANLPPDEVIFGNSPVMGKIRQKLGIPAGSNTPVLLHGHSGTGKEVLAKLLNCLSPWRNGAFLKISSPAVPGTLVERELFVFVSVIIRKINRHENRHKKLEQGHIIVHA